MEVKEVAGKAVRFYHYSELSDLERGIGCNHCPFHDRDTDSCGGMARHCQGGFLRSESYRTAEEFEAERALRKASSTQPALTLPTDSDDRKNVPLHAGVLAYFPAALAGVARLSKAGNDKHNPGQPLHHARSKSTDHADCIVRHLMDLTDMLAARQRAAALNEAEPQPVADILTEASSLAWRALALSQELHEKLGGAPLAPGASE